jgi:gluconolactonase
VGCGAATGALPAWRSAHCPPRCTGPVHDAGGSLRGQATEQPERPGVTSNGDLYFTDPPYGLPGTFTDPGRELDFTGVYRLGANGTLTLLTKELKAPNGIAFSPDEKTLYVAQSLSDEPVIMAHPVKPDGTIDEAKC